MQVRHGILNAALADAVRESGSPGAVAYVGDMERTHFFGAVGHRALRPGSLPARRDTIYDVASLTKVVATTTAVLLLHAEGLLDLDAPVSSYVPIPAFSAFTVRQLLTHTAGLRDLHPLYREVSSTDELLMRYGSEPFESAPGIRWHYTDVAYMILGRTVELAGRDRLDSLCRLRIFEPLGMQHTRFRPPPGWARRCAATEACPWRGRTLVGEVHDENASAVGGVAGHAGLFSTAHDLARFCRGLLEGRLLPDPLVAEMLRFGQVPRWPWQGLGWRLDPWSSDSTGYLPARTVFGHTGWTGCSLWVDSARGFFSILLGNTCHPVRRTRDNDTFRRVFYTQVAREFYPNTAATHTGLDRLVRRHFEPLRGRRIALLTHHAAVDQLGRPILDVFALEPDVALRAVYTPEHGLRGQEEAGATVPSEPGAVPVRSLYGARREPDPEEMKEVDVFVVDLQDVGARYYTYAATMKACIRACARAKVPVLVLDRPNPVGGRILEGPIAETTDSMTCWGAVPVRHGMTMGEIATFFAAGELAGLAPEVRVLPLDNWDRSRFFSACTLPWIAPSPNIPSPDTALLYTGMCLFEGTNLNEGRGTDTPFHVVGAPWLKAETLVEAITREDLPGCSLTPVTYAPRSIPGKAKDPRYEGQVCSGVRVEIHDRAQARPFTVATAILCALRQTHSDHFVWRSTFDTLAGTDALRGQIDRGDTPQAIISGMEAGLRVHDQARPKLYE